MDRDEIIRRIRLLDREQLQRLQRLLDLLEGRPGNRTPGTAPDPEEHEPGK